jgi:hypothetical protein
MSSVIISGDTSGSITLQAPSVAGTNTLTLPASTGTVMVNGPAFSAYLSANQTITSGTFTKVQINIKEFDTNSNYDNATNYRFTPTVAGYYQINGSIRYDASTTPTRGIIGIYKNGSEVKRGNDLGNNSTEAVISTLIYCNGSTDYIELWAFISAVTAIIGVTDNRFVYFQASMVRGA